MFDRVLRRLRAWRSLRPATALLVLVAGTALAVGPATAANAATTAPTPPLACSCRYTIPSIWQGGFVGDLAIRNDGPAWHGWVVEFDFTSDEQIVSAWNGIWTQVGSHVIVTSLPWNGDVYPGQILSLGFVASYQTRPGPMRDVKVNGTPCKFIDPVIIP